MKLTKLKHIKLNFTQVYVVYTQSRRYLQYLDMYYQLHAMIDCNCVQIDRYSFLYTP